MLALAASGCTIRSEPKQPEASAQPATAAAPSWDSTVPGADTSKANAYSRKLLSMHPQDRRVLFGRLVQSVGEKCDMADDALFQRSATGVDLWRARCPDQREWSVSIYLDASTKVLSCAVAEKVGIGCHNDLAGKP